MRNGWRGLTVIALLVVVRADGVAAQPAPGAPRSSATHRVVVSISDRKLALIENDRVVRIYDVAVGANESPTPIGAYTIVNRIANPTYYRPRKVIPAGAGNPLGTRWIGLSIKGFGIHGTDTPSSIGFPRSHGCIRMRNSDVEELFDRLKPGDVVEVNGANSIAELTTPALGEKTICIRTSADGSVLSSRP
jgi:lipoprotein-anchoring transpeptidase ErfK/SrfK